MPERNFNFFLSKGSFIALLSVVACPAFCGSYIRCTQRVPRDFSIQTLLIHKHVVCMQSPMPQGLLTRESATGRVYGSMGGKQLRQRLTTS